MTTSRRWRGPSYLSWRLWSLCALLLVLGTLALMQYRWINQIAEAQRQSTRENLATALSNVESDFDFEITRALLAFQLPVPSMSYAARYDEWRRDAPYPYLLRGIYIMQSGRETIPKALIPQEPAIHQVEWPLGFPELRPPFGAVSASVSGPTGFQVFSSGSAAGALVSTSAAVTVDGNPAFAFPAALSVSRLSSPVTDALAKQPHLQEAEVVRLAGPPKLLLVVFDANYIRSTFLPNLVHRNFRNSLASEFDVTAVERNGASPRIVFPAKSNSISTEFANPDGSVRLFQFRMDCFLASPPAKPVAIAASTGDPMTLLTTGRLSDILIRKPTVCGNPVPAMASHADRAWEILAKHHAGSLDQAVVTFRRRNLLLSGGVLFVLALGVSLVLLAAERARALAEMQAEFILGVSHELRTPLTVITVAADNLKNGMVNTSAQARSYGEIIHKHSAELSSMIEETFSFARMRSETIQRRCSITPEQIVKDAVAENDSVLRASGMNVEIGLAPELPQVEVDLHLIKRCLGNLLQNAAKYAAAGQRLAVHARTTVKRDKEVVEISVEDYGPGIREEDLSQIFEPFYRGEVADSSHVPGIGLGLTLVKRAVEAHGGTVEVQSGRTTRFSIFLPSYRAVPNGAKA